MNDKELPGSTQKPRFWQKKPFWIAMASVAAALTIQTVVWTIQDKPLKIESPTSASSQPNYAEGIGINFKERYDLRQDEYVLPADENGWKLFLQYFGPLALEQRFVAERVPWEEFPTAEETKSWFETFWTPACEKFGLDPKVKPVFLDRLSLNTYLVKNGVTGNEEVAQDDTQSENVAGLDEYYNDDKTYYEDREARKGKIGVQQALDVYNKLLESPWRGEDYPTAERWLEENADVYDVYAQAIRKPKFRMRHFVKDEPYGFIQLLLPDVQHIREVARLLEIRANYRIAKGDIDGAIDDIETMVLYGKSFFVGEDRCLIEGLVGVAISGLAASVKLGDNPDAAPTTEQWARLERVWNDAYAVDFREAAFNNLDGEYNLLFCPCCQDFTVLRRRGLGALAVYMMAADFNLLETDVSGSKMSALRKVYEALARNCILFRGPFDDAKFMQLACKYWDEAIERMKAGEDIDELYDSEIIKDRSPEAKAFAAYMQLLMPATNAALEAYRRLECVCKLKTLGNAALRYQAENGALPPAFTVDPEGKPLHSWRTLLLPYLGEEEKALYAKIKLDEPWDSEYNKQFHALAPQVYRCLSNPQCQAGDSAYSVILGEDSLFDASGKGKDLTELMKRSDRNTLGQALVVERLAPGCWMSPDRDVTDEFCRKTFGDRETRKEDGVGSCHSGGMNVALANGAACFLSTVTSPEELISGIKLPDSDDTYGETIETVDEVEETETVEEETSDSAE